MTTDNPATRPDRENGRYVIRWNVWLSRQVRQVAASLLRAPAHADDGQRAERAAVLVSRAMEADFSADVRRHLQAGLRNWRDCGGIVPLPLCLGLPGTPRRTAELARDAWLREAAATLTTATPWQLARAS